MRSKTEIGGKKMKLGFKSGVLIALGGISLVIGGVLNINQYTRIGGYILATLGLVVMGKRLYQRIKEKSISRGLE